MILDNDVRMLGLDGLGQRTQQGWLSDTCHILQTDFLGTGSNHLVGNGTIVLYGMHRTGGNTQRGLRNHTCGLGPLDRGNDVTRVVQTTEDTGDIHTLCLLHLIHQFTYVVGHGIHTQRVQTTVQHVRLDAYLVERLTESTYSIVRILAGHKVHLFKGTTIGFYTGKASHVNDDGSNTLQLVLAWLELT